MALRVDYQGSHHKKGPHLLRQHAPIDSLNGFPQQNEAVIIDSANAGIEKVPKI